MYIHTNTSRYICSEIDSQPARQADKQTDRRADRQQDCGQRKDTDTARNTKPETETDRPALYMLVCMFDGREVHMSHSFPAGAFQHWHGFGTLLALRRGFCTWLCGLCWQCSCPRAQSVATGC